MPYRKKKYRRKRKKTTYNIAKKALKKVNMISKAIELKHYDRNLLVSPIDWNPLFTNLNIPGQGLLDSNRVGDKIFVKGLWLKIVCDANSNQQGTYRFTLIYDKKNTISSSTILYSLIGEQGVVNSPFKVDERREYIVMKDKVFSLNQGSTREKRFSMSCRCNKLTQFDGGSTDITQGAIKLFVSCNLPDNLVTKPFFYGYSRIWYQDN